MKHLPNLLTLGNLMCGCIAIAFFLNSQPFLVAMNGEEYWVTGTEQAQLGSLFILLAAVCDLLDGFVARALKLFSPIGKDLDSLADVVSFGVAPSMILFKMLWAAYMLEPHALNVPMLAMAPAFLLACFGALRLARFNVSAPAAGGGFTGMPIPAVGILVASFPLLNWPSPDVVGVYLQNKWVLYLVIALLCWLMVSRIHFIKLMPQRWKLAYCWPQLLIVVATLAAVPFIGASAIPLAFGLYIVLSLVYRAPEDAQPATAGH